MAEIKSNRAWREECERLKAKNETLEDARTHAWKVAKNLQADVDVMRSALEAVKARYEGNFDHPSLLAQGPLHTHTVDDMYAFAIRALEQVEKNRGN